MTATRQITVLAVLATAACLTDSSAARSISTDRLPDTIEMKDGRSLRGLILKNTASNVLLQTEHEEINIPKNDIRRIRDEMDGEMVFAELTGKGKLPVWRSMVMDMREHDSIYSFQQIPATAVEVGIFKNIPYLSFRVNEQSEFNIYGHPDNPVALEFGMYGKRKNSMKYRQIVREFLAGHLHSREEIGALYSISLKGGKKQVGNLVFEITPPKQADSYGGWWISIYDQSRIEGARVSDKKYAAVTRPFDEINNRNGTLKKNAVEEEETWLSESVRQLTGLVPKIRGFYRDKQGVFRLISFGNGS